MDRGIPNEALLQEMRPLRKDTYYLVGTSRAKVKQYEKKWLDLPWRKVRDSVQVKLFDKDGELYVLDKSEGRQAKETAIRRNRLAIAQVARHAQELPKRDRLLMRVGGGQEGCGAGVRIR